MSHDHIHKLVRASLFAALCTIMTLVIQVPSPMQGYVNLGDCAVLLSAWVLGPWYGGAAAGVGSMLADLLSGYAHYAPGTFAVKLAMAVAAGCLFRALRNKAIHPLPAQLAAYSVLRPPPQSIISSAGAVHWPGYKKDGAERFSFLAPSFLFKYQAASLQCGNKPPEKLRLRWW